MYLIDALPDGSEVDGHDAGSGEVNIFDSTTEEPKRAFDELKRYSRHRGF